MKERGTIFRQSLKDFPCSITLGKKNPTWAIKRWQSNNGLNFTPIDDEDFSLRGDKQRLIYKGRKRSHRFTIFNDDAFEYDCILKREPESNVITMRMEGAEYFDFFHQPDFVPDPFLKGSYAVYLKETLIGQGTGKLCHIHRPLIIDALGRKEWGELSVVGNELRITIDEIWLSEAKYPVIVDPTVGTTMVGSQNKWCPDDDGYLTELFFEFGMPVNRFLINEKINGICTAFYYSDFRDSEGGGRPILYSDNANKPNTRMSSNENFVDLRFSGSWRSGTFIGDVSAGSNIWFGLFCEYYWFPRFDYGATCYNTGWEGLSGIPNTYPEIFWYCMYDLKLSMYFTYSSAQNYVRTLTQGINLTDIKKIKADYKRLNTQTTNIIEKRYFKADYKRFTFNSVIGVSVLRIFFSFFRKCLMNVNNKTGIFWFPIFNRYVNDDIKIDSMIKNNRKINIKCDDVIYNSDITDRIRGFIGKIADNIDGTDDVTNPLLFARTVNDKQTLTDNIRQAKEYFRYLFEEAGNIANVDRRGEFCRIENDSVFTFDSAVRHFFIFVKILTTSLIRDFVLRRFLIAREELVLKSCITREIKLESKIN